MIIRLYYYKVWFQNLGVLHVVDHDIISAKHFPIKVRNGSVNNYSCMIIKSLDNCCYWVWNRALSHCWYCTYQKSRRNFKTGKWEIAMCCSFRITIGYIASRWFGLQYWCRTCRNRLEYRVCCSVKSNVWQSFGFIWWCSSYKLDTDKCYQSIANMDNL